MSKTHTKFNNQLTFFIYLFIFNLIKVNLNIVQRVKITTIIFKGHRFKFTHICRDSNLRALTKIINKLSYVPVDITKIIFFF